MRVRVPPFLPVWKCGPVAEPVDAADLKSAAIRRAGSSPARLTRVNVWPRGGIGRHGSMRCCFLPECRFKSCRGHHCFCFYAPVAQLDRAPGYELGGRRFESFRARQSTKIQATAIAVAFSLAAHRKMMNLRRRFDARTRKCGRDNSAAVRRELRVAGGAWIAPHPILPNAMSPQTAYTVWIGGNRF